MKNRPDVGVRMPNGCTCVRRAAEQLDCSARHVRRLIRDRKLRALRIGLRYWAVFCVDVNLLNERRAQCSR